MKGQITVALANDPPNVDPAVWDDHTPALRTAEVGAQLLKVSRGRDDELSAMNPATGQLRLDNRDRTYDPRVSSTVRPYTHVRVELERDATTLPLLRGFVEGIEQTHVDAEDRYATLRLIDALKWLARTDVTVDRPAELSGTRIAAILDAAGWPAALRDIDDGQVIVDPLVDVDAKALQLIDEAVAAEDGTFATAPDGPLTFRDRHARLDLEPTLTIEIDEPAEQLGAWDDDLLANVAKIELSDGTVARHADDGSIATFGRMLWENPDLPVSFAEAEAVGMWTLLRYAHEHERLAPVRFRITSADSPLLELVDGQLVVLRRRWPDDTVDELEMVVEGTVDDIAPASWWRTVTFSPWWGDHDWLVVAEDDTDDVFGLDEGVAAP